MSRQLEGRTWAAWSVALSGLALAGALLILDQRAGTSPTAPPLELGAASPALLDTLAFRGRRIEASLDGWVAEVAPDGLVWLGSDALAFPVALPDTADVAEEDRLLVTGRLRGRGGRRWLDATAWSEVRGVAE